MPKALGMEGVDFSKSYTVNTASTPEVTGPPFKVGTVETGDDGSSWMFVKLAVSQTIASGDFVYVSSIDTTFLVTLLANAAVAKRGMFVGVAGAAATSGTTSYEFIWIQRAGYRAGANCLTGSLANVVLHTTATNGRIDDSAAGGTSATVDGVVQLATAAANAAAVYLNWPVIGVAD
jgi:hypothetical protein